MEAERMSGVGSGNSGTYTAEIAESFRFEEEIQSLIHPSFDASPAAGGSFTALLGLPATQAVELLHEPGPGAAASSQAGELWRLRLGEHAAAPVRLPLGCGAPTFPSNAALVERTTKFSEFAADESPASSSGGDPSPRLKVEPPDSDSPPSVPQTTDKAQRSSKRKECEKNKAKGTTKKSKSTEETDSAKVAPEADTAADKLPYVHVRARRGQATDSHSLAERARREKINARMKLLQELVPGCSKITGTALVLDEIINHVQYLQRQVEFLSMKLATVNTRINLSSLDSFLSAEHGPLANGRVGLALDPALWSPDAAAASGVGRLPQQHIWHVDLLCAQPSTALWDRAAESHPHALLNTAASVLGYDPANANECKPIEDTTLDELGWCFPTPAYPICTEEN